VVALVAAVLVLAAVAVAVAAGRVLVDVLGDVLGQASSRKPLKIKKTVGRGLEDRLGEEHWADKPRKSIKSIKKGGSMVR